MHTKIKLFTIFCVMLVSSLLHPTAQAAITYFASASNPADNISLDLTTVAVTPPGAMQAGDLVVMIANVRESGQALAMSATGGQTWTSETANTTTASHRIFWARYNGTWSANPSVSFPAGANGTTLVMHVFRPTLAANTWALDVALTNSSFTSPGGARDVTINGITTLTNGALVLAVWVSRDNNTWGLQTAGWANAGLTQYRNGDGNDVSQSTAYKVMPTLGASGDVTNRQITLGGDSGNSAIIAFKEVSTSIVVGGFNAYETSTAAGAISGLIQTKVAGTSFNLAVIALNAAKSAIQTTFTGAVKVELLNSSSGGALDANGCNAGWSVIQTLTNPTFVVADNGRKTVAFQENNAWSNVRVRASYPAVGAATAIGCSNDNFAIRPSAFANVSVSDLDSQTAGTARSLNNTSETGGNVHRAGRPFTLSATAVNGLVAPAATTNYTGTPSAVLSACVGSGCTATLGTLSAGAAAVAGVVNTSSASYSEVGAFNLQLQDQTFAAVDASDTPGDCTGRYVCSATLSVGRFVPDRFVLATNNTPAFKTFNDTTCAPRSFTYIGQSFGYVTAPQALLSAQNAAGGVTTNYQGSLWKLAASDLTQTYLYTLTPASTPGLDVSLIGAPTLADNSNGTGTATANSSGLLSFTRSASTELAPFTAAINLSMSVTDSSENAVSGNGVINTVTPALFSSIAFDSGNAFRYGRLRLMNAHGSELLNLPVPTQTQYWNGTSFIINAADNCTTLQSANITLVKTPPACTTTVSGNVSFSAGLGNLTLNKPNAKCTADITVNLTAENKIYLQGKWSGFSYDQNPTARASFGLYKGGPLIYQRENY